MSHRYRCSIYRNQKIRHGMYDDVLLWFRFDTGGFLQFMLDFFSIIGLQQITDCFYAKRIQCILLVCGNKHNADIFIFLFQPFCQFQSIHYRHFHIQKCYVNRIFFCPFQSSLAFLEQLQSLYPGKPLHR